MRISFIIPHKGREEFLAQTIASIHELDVGGNQVEIVVVTQNATFSHPAIQPYLAFVKVISRPEHETIATLRNIGVSHSTGEYLAFLDADIELARNWLTVMLGELNAAPDRMMVGAVQQCGPDAGAVEKIRTILSQASADRPAQFLGSGNLLLRRSTFEQVNGFPAELATCEDYYFTERVTQLGEVYCTSKTSFVHLGEDQDYAALFRKERWRGQSNWQSLKGRHIPLKELPSIVAPLWIVLFACVTVICSLFGKLVFAAGGLALMSIPTLLYAFRVYKLGAGQISFGEALAFYAAYHAARAIGTPISFLTR